MNKIQKYVIGTIAAGSMLISSALPLLASTYEITGNGADSSNTVSVDQNSTTGVQQSNTAEVTNNVTTTTSTGGNEASKNTGGSVSVTTGDAGSQSTVTNAVNTNAASVNCCGTTSADVTISGNGADTHNTVDLDINKGGEKSATTGVTQTNVADVTNNVTNSAYTGANEAEKNTNGNVSIKTGDAFAGATVSTTGNVNVAEIGGGAPAGSLSVMLTGNGADSHNSAYIDLNSSALVEQTNSAEVTNNVGASAKTGKNEAEKNTGGDSSIQTGDAGATATVENQLNFNVASLDCGCLVGSDVLFKIGGNGADTHNKIHADLTGGSFATQENVADLLNNVTGVKALTGKNEVESSTGSVLGDPMIKTGDSMISTTVTNDANHNTVGSLPFDLPDLSNMQLSWDWQAFMAWFSAHVS